MTSQRLVSIGLAILLCGAVFPAEANQNPPVDVPDEFGMGERLSLVAWFRDHKIDVADPNDLPSLRAAYLRMTRPPEPDAKQEGTTAKAEEMSQVDDLKTTLWVRHGRSIAGFPPVSELQELLRKLDGEAEAAFAAKRAEAERLVRKQSQPAVIVPAVGVSQLKATPAAQAAPTGSSGITPTSLPPTALPPDATEPPPGSWREAQSEAGTTYRLLCSEVMGPLQRRAGPRPTWYVTAMRYMENNIARSVNSMITDIVPAPTPLLRWLLAAGCKDPGFQVTACLYNGEFVHDPDPMFAALEREGYSLRLRQACAAKIVEYAWHFGVAVQNERHQRYFDIASKLGIQLLHSDLRDPRLKSIVARQLRTARNIFYPDQDCLDFMAVYVAEINRCKSSLTAVDPWLSAMLLGQSELMLAWKARGNGYANQVTEDGWEGFRRHQETAKAQFETAWAIDPKQPLAATMRIAVAMGMSEGSDVIMAWLDRAVTVCPDHAPAYSMASLALSPQWGGTPHLQMEVARRAIQTGDYTSPAVHMFHDLLQPPGVSRLRTWDDLSRIVSGYIESPYFSEMRNKNLHHMIDLAYSYQHPKIVVSTIEKLDGKPDLKLLGKDASKIMELYQKAKNDPFTQPSNKP